MENENEMSYAESLAFNAACNAVRIAELLPEGTLMPGAFPSPTFDRVAKAAVVLAKIETMPSGSTEFWADVYVDWETVCERLARLVVRGDPVIEETVRAAMTE